MIDKMKKWSPNTPREQFPMVEIKKMDLMSTTQELIKRLLVEFERYFPSPDGDSCVALQLHPVIVSMGFE